MEGLAVLVGLLVVGAVLCGPVALVIAISALAKANRHEVMLEARKERAQWGAKPATMGPVMGAATAAGPAEGVAEEKPEPAAPVEEKWRAGQIRFEVRPEKEAAVSAAAEKAAAPAAKEAQPSIGEAARRPAATRAQERAGAKRDSLEQRIGTRWVLMAGVVTVIVAVGFFLKFAYENALIPPIGRVIIVAVSGLIALATGEVTRRRGYDIVAKAVTALGFAILYAADFAAFRMYHLIPAIPAIGLATVITAGAMAYAVALDEIIIALVSLAGGFLAPLMISTGDNLPHHLFSYCLVLGLGAAFCAFYRRWRAVNAMAFLGTFILYTAWFEKFFRPELARDGRPEQMGIALGWLAVFFAVYLVLPVLHTLVRKVKALAEDVLLVLSNAMVVFYYLWTVLYDDLRAPLALAAVILGLAHLVFAGVVTLRCREDVNLRAVLLVIGLFFVTVAVPLYFEQDAVVLGWGIEGFVLAVVGCRYRNYLIQLGAGAAILLATAKLFCNLPMHMGAFAPVFNPQFGTWCFMAAVVMLCHLLYRRSEEISAEIARPLSQLLYAAALGLLAVASMLEWYWHCDYNLKLDQWDGIFFRGMLMILAALYLLLAARPMRPKGLFNPGLAVIVAGAGSIYAGIISLTAGYENLNFIAAGVFIAGLFAAGWILSRAAKEEACCGPIAACFAFGAIAVLGVVAGGQACNYYGLPRPKGDFSLVFNAQFGTWLLVAGIAILCHLLYRRSNEIKPQVAATVSQVLYAAALGILTFASVQEWQWYCDYNFGTDVANGVFFRGVLIIFTALYLLLIARPLRPSGPFNPIVGLMAAIGASVYAAGEMWEAYHGAFVMFFNPNFAAAVVFIAGLFVAAWLLRRGAKEEAECGMLAGCFAIGAIALLWVMISEQIYVYYEESGRQSWRFMANMWMSVAWAVYGAVLMVVGFWKNLRALRYMALGLFGLLVAKIFVIDMSTVKSVYRITAFLATGLTLVGVSYLYQFLKKQGFFDRMLAEATQGEAAAREK